MRDFRWRRSLAAPLLLLSVTMGLASGAACAQTTPYSIVVQPIDVCNSAGNICSPVNSMGQSIISPGGGPNMPVGWFDPTTGANISQAILLAGINVNVTFLPLVQYNSAANPYSTSSSQPDFRFLHVAACSTCASGMTSLDLAMLAQQPYITNNGTVPNPTTPGPSTPCAVDMNGVLESPCVRVSNTATVIDWFMVDTLIPLTPGQLYGLTWKVGFNGIATGKNAMVGVPLSGLKNRPDTFIHEAMHAAGLDHAIFGSGPYNPYGPNNLQGGFVPVPGESPSIGECNSGYPACAANLMTAGGMGAVNLRTEPTVANALTMLQAGTADQMTTEAQQGPNLPVSQQMAALASSSGFINAITNSMLTAMKPASAATAGAAVKSTVSSTAGTSGTSSSIIFTASGSEPPPNGSTNVLVIMPPSPLKFDPKNPFKILFQSRNNLVQDVDYFPDSDNNPNNPNAKYPLGTAAYSACTAEGAQCLIVEFNPPFLGPTDQLQFSQGVTSHGLPVTLPQLAGAYVTFALNLGTTTTSQYITTSQLMCNSGECTAGSQTTSPTLPPPQITNPVNFPGNGNPPCTPIRDANNNLICQDFAAAGTVDSVPCDEGGQPSGLICP
jgi:hypothetical protein